MNHRGWEIQITEGRFETTCQIISPSGEEYPVFVARGNDRHQAANAARAMINRIIDTDDLTLSGGFILNLPED